MTAVFLFPKFALSALYKSMSTYVDRKLIGVQAEAQLERFLDSKHVRYHRLTIERLVPDATWRSLVTACTSFPALEPLRYLPDYYIDDLTGGMYLDVKASYFLEEKCFLNYTILGQKAPVLLAIIRDNYLMIANVKELKFCFSQWTGSANGSGKPCNKVDLLTTKHKKFYLGEDERTN